METAIVSVMCIALIVVGGMTMSQGFLSSADSAMVGVEELTVRDGEIMRTELALLTTDVNDAGRTLEVSLRNSGQVKLASFSKWDVIVEYYGHDGGYYITWLPYVDGTPGSNQWTVEGIYLSSENLTAEVFEPGILSPGEEMVIKVELDPRVRNRTAGEVVISTPSGVSASTHFLRE